jgi:hypothetical protein
MMYTHSNLHARAHTQRPHTHPLLWAHERERDIAKSAAAKNVYKSKNIKPLLWADERGRDIAKTAAANGVTSS